MLTCAADRTLDEEPTETDALDSVGRADHERLPGRRPFARVEGLHLGDQHSGRLADDGPSAEHPASIDRFHRTQEVSRPIC